MDNPKWFDRKFDFSFGADQYPVIYQRLKQAPERLKGLMMSLQDDREDRLVHKPAGAWSVKEHAGHLSVLERVWRTRFQDIREKKPLLTPADLENKATSEAGFNEWSVTVLLGKFVEERGATLALLDEIGSAEESRTSLHPRLRLPMRIVDLAYFVAEHDEHHLSAIRTMSGSPDSTLI